MKKSIKYQVLSIKHGALVICLSFAICHLSFCQQLPYYTQFGPNNIMLNPAVAGTKRLLDARIDYRTQWVGFDDAPKTEGVSLNSRLVNGTMGVGTAFYSDQTGPTRRTDLSAIYSFHAKFDDVELSIGAAGHMLSYFVDGTQLNMHIPYDNVIDLTTTQKKTVYDANFGALLYNDRFHVGLSILNLFGSTINYYPQTDTAHKTTLNLVSHIYGSVGYNWSNNEDLIWENNLQVVYVQANPITVDYNLRVHYKQKVFGGFALRLHDAIALQVGYTMKDFQVSYSYDFITSSLRQGQSGSHEIMIIWSSNLGTDKKGKGENHRFRHQKYGYMF